MIVWNTTKRWKYKGRNCEILVADFDGTRQYRGYVELKNGASEETLAALPTDEHLRQKTRPKTWAEDEYSAWVYFSMGSHRGDDLEPLRTRVDRVAELTDDLPCGLC